MTDTTHITTSGGLISAAFVENVRDLDTRQRGTEPESFALPWTDPPKGPAALEDEIAAAWELILERWDGIHDQIRMMDVSQVRQRWLLPLFSVLDFDPVYLRSDVVLDEAGKLRYSLSHRGWKGEGAPIIHTVSPSQPLDERQGSGGRGIKAKSPHDLIQAFLNASTGPHDGWGLLSNGVLLRVLREYHHTYTKGYIQFDLEGICETRNYGDFRALYRMCHASRFIEPQTLEVLPPLEQFYKDSLATGIKVGEDLRGQVREAIETLGNGFLATSPDLIHRLQQDDGLCRQYYGEILHVIYRMLFLLFAEQRGMMPGRESLYAETYSIAALRAQAEGDLSYGMMGGAGVGHTDLWEGLKVTFRMVREGVPALDVFGYDGMLFAEHQTPLLDGGERSRTSPGERSRTIRNSDLLRTVRALTLIEREGVLQRISYADLGVEELGSIYESLLDFTPRVTARAEAVEGRSIPPHTFFLDPRGSERKTTGSYYTHDSLVDELIKSALLPVARERLAAAGLPVHPEGDLTGLVDLAGLDEAQRAAGEEALLSLKVCDPAAGSGHFLVKANDALGAELARLRSGDEYPTTACLQAAKRDVLAHSIYAVDLNPMAVELCKVSLWINASVADRPLSFLDHHIKCGDSLLGTTPELMSEGIPYQAFDQGMVGNDRATANGIRKRNRQEEAGQLSLWQVTVIETPADLAHWRKVANLAGERPQAAREQYVAYLAGDAFRRRKLEADFWTAAFFWPLPQGTSWAPTHGEFRRLQAEGPAAIPAEALARVEALAERYHFFHWHLEFPDVFEHEHEEREEREEHEGYEKRQVSSPSCSISSPSCSISRSSCSVSRPSYSVSSPSCSISRSSCSGFDVVLGNPPWERIKLQEKEFFADKNAEIADARTAAARRRLIKALPQTDPELHAAYVEALRASEAASHFLRESGRFPLSAVGDINTYQVFAGLARQIVGSRGRVGIVVPSGIATDYYNQDYFSAIVEAGELVSLYDFENRRKLFSEVDSRMKFCLLTLTGGEVEEAEYGFFLHTTDDLADPERRFGLSREEVALMNPNTGTVPVFRTRRDADLTKKLYRAAPVLVNEETGENPWGVSFLRMFDMANDSHLFHTQEELEAQGFTLEGNRFMHGDEVYLPLYEAKMFWHFDHRFGSFEGVSGRSDTHINQATNKEYANPIYLPLSWYWVKGGEVVAKSSRWDRNWWLGFRRISNVTNERTFILSVLPLSASGDSVFLLLPQKGLMDEMCGLIANLNCLSFDYIVRQKMGGTNLNYFYVKQFPILPPDRYTFDLLDFIVPRVVELTYTAWDLHAFAQNVLDEVGEETWARWFASDHLGSPASVHDSPPPSWAASDTPAPFIWDEDRRAVLRAELDAVYAHLYGLTRDELAYILDTFPIVKRKDEAKYGEYRTKRMVLEAFESLRPLTE